MTLSRYDGRREELAIEPGEGDYECLVPPARFIDLITGASTENRSRCARQASARTGPIPRR